MRDKHWVEQPPWEWLEKQKPGSREFFWLAFVNTRPRFAVWVIFFLALLKVFFFFAGGLLKQIQEDLFVWVFEATPGTGVRPS